MTLNTEAQTQKKRNMRGLLALSPMLLFLILYLVTSLLIGDFYRMPISVALLAASVFAVMVCRGHDMTERIHIFTRAAGDRNVIYMIGIFILAGAFTALANKIGCVESMVNLTLKVCPEGYVVPVFFLASCLISLSIGTSVGTVVALVPLATEMARISGGNLPYLVAAVLGGAFFGDNLSFISDTTIAATRSQGCNMKDKFKANLWIALPAAVVTLAVYVYNDQGIESVSEPKAFAPWLTLPYLIVLATALMGIQVTSVLTLGLSTTFLLGWCKGTSPIDMAGYMGEGIESMGSLITVTLLSAGMLGVIKAGGGIAYLLQVLTKRIHNLRGAQAVIALLAGTVNLCTANNTIAIISVGSIAREISEKYGIDARKAASLLDSSTCVVQCLIPYGAQALLAASLAELSPAAAIPYLYYPWALALFIALSIIFLFPRRLNH